MASNDITFIPIFVKIGQLSKSKREAETYNYTHKDRHTDTYRHTQTHHGGLINGLHFLKKGNTTEKTTTV
jgi:hypothetical protein